jgi:outer membrane protein assembly factor BamB
MYSGRRVEEAAGGVRGGFSPSGLRLFTQVALASLAARILARTALGIVVGCFFQFGLSMTVAGADQPQWGTPWTRNLVSAERGLPDGFDPKTGRNIKWRAPLGHETHSTPIIAGGKVYIGTNNDEPRDPRHSGDRGVLMCFHEASGALVWQWVVPKREEDPFHDWPKSGISSPVTVEGTNVFVVNNRGEVACLDAGGLANGNDGPFRDEGAHMTPRGTNAPPRAMTPGPLDADVLWLCNLTTEAGIWSHDAAHSSILIDGDYLYLNSGTGVDNTHKRIRTPQAPSLLVLDKATGRILARDDEPIAPNIFHCTWSAPSMATIQGRKLVFLAAGNGVVYAFEPLTRPPPPGDVARLKTVWSFDFDPTAPKENVHRYNTNRRESPSNIYGMPVVEGTRLLVAGGGDLFWGKNEAWLKCIDATRSGEVTRSAEIWSYGLEKHVLATPTIHEGLIYLADCGRKFHCVDAATGRAVWTHDLVGEVWGSALVADGKVYLGTRKGEFLVFAAGREKRLLSSVQLDSPISATPTAANGTLYVATMSVLYAIQAR